MESLGRKKLDVFALLVLFVGASNSASASKDLCVLCICQSNAASDGTVRADCRGAKLASISAYRLMNDMWRATELNLGNNLINELRANTFQLQTELRILNLERNDIETVDRASFNISGADWQRSGISPLEVINLNDNYLIEVPGCFSAKQDYVSSLDNLHTLLLGGNPIGKSIFANSFNGLPKLTRLDLSRAAIAYLPDKIFRKNLFLKFLDLSDNLISSFPQASFPRNSQLLVLRLDGNRFTSIPQSLPGSLRDLRMANNLLRNVTWEDIKSPATLSDLRVLDISSNAIGLVLPGTFRRLMNLRYLDMSGNDMEAVLPWTFLGLENLEFLWLNNNAFLSSIEEDSFSNLANLKYLFLQGCSITKIRSSNGNGASKMNDVLPSLRYMWLYGNPLNCNCELIPFLRYVRERELAVDKDFQTVPLPLDDVLRDAVSEALRRIGGATVLPTICVSPQNRYRTVVGRRILALPEHYLSCPDELIYIVVASSLGIALFVAAVPVVYCLVGFYLLLVNIAQNKLGWKFGEDDD